MAHKQAQMYRKNVTRMKEVLEKAKQRGFKHCADHMILDEARSVRHLRKLIGQYQDGNFKPSVD